jgi:hypothetical protein
VKRIPDLKTVFFWIMILLLIKLLMLIRITVRMGNERVRNRSRTSKAG